MCRCTGGKQVEVENLVGRRMWLPSSGSGQPSTTGASWWPGPTTSYFSGMVATRDARCQSSEGRGWRGVWGAKFLQLYKENNIILKINDTTWWRSWHNLYYKMQLYPQCQNVIILKYLQATYWNAPHLKQFTCCDFLGSQFNHRWSCSGVGVWISN